MSTSDTVTPPTPSRSKSGLSVPKWIATVITSETFTTPLPVTSAHCTTTIGVVVGVAVRVGVWVAVGVFVRVFVAVAVFVGV